MIEGVGFEFIEVADIFKIQVERRAVMLP